MAYLVDFVAFSPGDQYRQERNCPEVVGKWVHWGPEHGVSSTAGKDLCTIGG